MQAFDGFLDHVSPANWLSLEGQITWMLLRSTGTEPDLSAGSVAAVLSGGSVEITDTAYVRLASASHTVTPIGRDRRIGLDSLVWVDTGDDTAGQDVLGALGALEVTDDSDSPPLLWVPEFAGTLRGTTVTLQFSNGLWLFDADPA